MTQSKAKVLRASLESNVNNIYLICSEVLEKSRKVSLVRATLEAMLCFTTWIPLRYVFETTLIDVLITRVRFPTNLPLIQHADILIVPRGS